MPSHLFDFDLLAERACPMVWDVFGDAIQVVAEKLRGTPISLCHVCRADGILYPPFIFFAGEYGLRAVEGVCFVNGVVF